MKKLLIFLLIFLWFWINQSNAELDSFSFYLYWSDYASYNVNTNYFTCYVWNSLNFTPDKAFYYEDWNLKAVWVYNSVTWQSNSCYVSDSWDSWWFTWNSTDFKLNTSAFPWPFTSSYNWSSISTYFVSRANSTSYWHITNWEDLSTTEVFESNIITWYEYMNWPPELSSWTIDSVTSLENWIEVEFTCDQDCEVIAWVYSEDESIFYNSVTNTFSGWTDTIQIPVSLQYQWNYKTIVWFYDLNNPEIEILDSLIFTYWYDPDPNDYEVWDFTFSSFWFERLLNGFEITNLDVEPKWWVFFLNILAPNWYETGEYSNYYIRVWEDHSEEWVYSTWYGSGSITQVTYPYHRFAWDYELLISYQYSWWIEIYPYWTGAINYSISNPEWSEEDSALFNCDSNDDGYVSETELLDCNNNLEWNFLDWIYNFWNSIKLFFREFMKIWNVEPKEWWFFLIPQANADSIMNDIQFNTNEWEDNILTDLESFLKWFVIFAFLILSVILIIVINKKE
jgi:hypothetical protein